MTPSSGPPFYCDPSSASWQKPNLIGGLMASPTLEHLAPLERQATIVLAWLLHHSRAFSSALLRRFFEGDDEAQTALDAPLEKIGARAWGTLRPIAGVTRTSIYPDLSIAGSGRSFELLVEIKVGAGTHSWELGQGTQLSQPDAYLRSWLDNYDEDEEAKVRRVGTLTLKGPDVPLTLGPYGASHLTWAEVDDVLAELLENGSLEAEVVAVAIDTRAAIQSRILGLMAGPELDDPVLAWGYVFLSSFAPLAASALPGGALKTKPQVVKDYVSAYAYHTSPSGMLRTWFAVTPRDAKYNLPGEQAMLWVGEPDTKWPTAAKASLADLGFHFVKDIAGYPGFRLGFPVAEIQSWGDEGAQVATLLERLTPVIDALAAA